MHMTQSLPRFALLTLPLPAPNPGKGILALLLLAMLAAVPWQAPGLMAGLLGALVLMVGLPHPRRHPLPALAWAVLTLALPLTLALRQPGLTLGGALTMGAAGLWAMLAIRAHRRCD